MKVVFVEMSVLCDCGETVRRLVPIDKRKTRLETATVVCPCGTKFFTHIQEVKK